MRNEFGARAERAAELVDGAVVSDDTIAVRLTLARVELRCAAVTGDPSNRQEHLEDARVHLRGVEGRAESNDVLVPVRNAMQLVVDGPGGGRHV